MKYVTLEPNWPNTLRWQANAYITNSFEFGAVSPMISLIEQVRYLTQKDPDTLEDILNELRRKAD